MKNLKKIVILHSNDMHGDFLAKEVDDKLLGGVSFLSGYINQVPSVFRYSLQQSGPGYYVHGIRQFSYQLSYSI